VGETEGGRQKVRRGAVRSRSLGGANSKALHAKMKNNSDCPPDKLIFATLASRAPRYGKFLINLSLSLSLSSATS
jgi:hypothetical protein